MDKYKIKNDIVQDKNVIPTASEVTILVNN
jgi:hypothetical protein